MGSLRNEATPDPIEIATLEQGDGSTVLFTSAPAEATVDSFSFTLLRNCFVQIICEAQARTVAGASLIGQMHIFLSIDAAGLHVTLISGTAQNNAGVDRGFMAMCTAGFNDPLAVARRVNGDALLASGLHTVFIRAGTGGGYSNVEILHYKLKVVAIPQSLSVEVT